MAKKKQKIAYHLLIQQGKIHLAPPKQISKNVPYENPTDTFKKPVESFTGIPRGGSADSWPMSSDYRRIKDPMW